MGHNSRRRLADDDTAAARDRLRRGRPAAPSLDTRRSTCGVAISFCNQTIPSGTPMEGTTGRHVEVSPRTGRDDTELREVQVRVECLKDRSPLESDRSPILKACSRCASFSRAAETGTARVRIDAEHVGPLRRAASLMEEWSQTNPFIACEPSKGSEQDAAPFESPTFETRWNGGGTTSSASV